MRSIIPSVGALLLSAAILLAGGGLLGTLVAVRAQLEDFPLPFIGLMLSAYYVGFVSGCFLTPHFVARVGHIRAFVALAAIVAAVTHVYALNQNAYLWMVMRIITGFGFAGLYMIVESWINEKSPNDSRGKVLSVYRIVDLVAVTTGQYLLTVGDPKDFTLFSMVSILICLSIVPIAMTKASSPALPANTSLNLRKLISMSPFGVLGALAVGLANGAFWGVSPVMVQQLGYGLPIVATFMSVAIVAGALSQWPAGLLSDKVDRRWVLILCAGLSAASGFFLWGAGGHSLAMLLMGSVFYGFAAMPLFGLSAAHANDYADADDFVAVSGGLLLLYGLGSIVGPFAASVVMGYFSPTSIFAYTAVVHVSLFLFGLYRLTRRDPVPDYEKDDYVAVPRTSPSIFEIDPRSETKEDESS